MSVGQRQFSLNGGQRSQGWVGQTSLTRVSNENGFLNDPTAIKTSVLNTHGMIDTHYRWIRRPQPFTVFKEHATIDQSTHIKNLQKKINQQCEDY